MAVDDCLPDSLDLAQTSGEDERKLQVSQQVSRYKQGTWAEGRTSPGPFLFDVADVSARKKKKKKELHRRPKFTGQGGAVSVYLGAGKRV